MNTRALLLISLVALAACDKPAAEATLPVASTIAPEMQYVDEAEPVDVDTYELTMDNVDRMLKAQVAMSDAMKKDATLDPAMNVSEEDDAQYVARLDGTPAFKQAIEGAGMTVHDYAHTTQSLVVTMMAPDAPGVNPRNAAFVKEHGAEIRQKMETLAARQD